MQGNFTIGFSGKKSDIARVKAAYWESMSSPDEYIDTIRTEGFERLADGDPAKILFRANSSINGKSEKKWVPGKLENISTVSGCCYYLIV